MDNKHLSLPDISQYGLDGSDYHSIMMTSGLSYGTIQSIHAHNKHELYVIIEGSLAKSVKLTAQRVIKIIKHDDGVTTDYIPFNFIPQEGTQLKN